MRDRVSKAGIGRRPRSLFGFGDHLHGQFRPAVPVGVDHRPARVRAGVVDQKQVEILIGLGSQRLERGGDPSGFVEKRNDHPEFAISHHGSAPAGW